MKIDAYQMATDRICELLEQGVKPWAKPWTSVMNCGWSGADGHPYTMLNQMLLADPNKKYKDIGELISDIQGEWITYNEAKKRGGNIRKGEHGRKVIFFRTIEKKENEGTAEEKIKQIPIASVSVVFHIRQCEGIQQKFHIEDDKLFNFNADQNADDVANDYIAREGITFKTIKSDKAYYSPATDTVSIPLPEQFKDWTEYYSTLFHELTHSTGHEKRLNRLSKAASFGSDDYSTEELIAEIGSATICSTLGIDTANSMTNSASYIKHWLDALRNDKKMIVTASSKAEKAVRLIFGIKENENDEKEIRDI